MNILLINPSQSGVYGVEVPQVYPPLGLLYVAAVLEQEGHNVEIADIDVQRLDAAKFTARIKAVRPQMVGITSTTPTFQNALWAARVVKESDSRIPTVLGGIHATIFPEGCICQEELDYVVVGEGEYTIVELASQLEQGGGRASHVRGIWCKLDGNPVYSGERELLPDLDSLPFPAHHLLKGLDAYTPPDALKRPILSIMTTRGCPGDCTYCCTKQIFTRRVRFRSVDSIIGEIERARKEFGIREVHFADDCFTINKRRVLQFCEEVKRRGIRLSFNFMNGLRACDIDSEILSAMKEIGLYNVGFGVESGNEEILKRIKKGITKDQTRLAFRIAKEIGLETWGFFMVGLPGETRETVRDTIEFAKELDPDYAKFYILKPFPGTEVYNELDTEGLILDRRPQNYGIYTAPVHMLSTMSPAEMQYWQKRAIREFYLRPSKIISHLKRVKSWTQLKLNLKAGLFLLKLSLR